MAEQSKKSSPWTIDEILKWTTRYFAEKSISTPRLDAEILLAHALSAERLYLYLNMDRPLSPSERSTFRELVKRRARREPVALITGRKEFWSTSFRTVLGVLIPRPETEVLVEAVLQEIKEVQFPQVLEVGTGSGAISVAVARENPRARIVATDVDPTAITVARLNAEETGVSQYIDFAAMNLFDGIRPDPRFDVVCSNPPYVPTDVVSTLAPEITHFEPLRALDGGPDGLDTIRKLVAQASQFMKQTGALILEMGDGQGESVTGLFTSVAGLREVRILRDLSGKPRVVRGKF
jgi:release factor glutamine methyltransferase